MPIEIRPGSRLPIPCRHCGALIHAVLIEGVARIECGECSRLTELRVYREGNGWRVATADVAARE